MIRFPMPAPVSPGDTLAGKYRVDRLLGEGGWDWERDQARLLTGFVLAF